MNEPRGYRLNNPLCIKISTPPIAWQGLRSVPRDPVLLDFEDPRYGIRAAARNMQTYQERRGIRTMRGVIERWAPPKNERGEVENDTSAYITAVRIYSGIDPDARIDLTDYATVWRLMRAMARVELGDAPDDMPEYWYTDAVWEQGLRMAGLAPTKALTKSRTIQGTATAGAGITAAIGVLTDTLGLPPEVAGLLPAALTGLSDQAVAAITLGIALAGALYAAWARRDDQRKGRL